MEWTSRFLKVHRDHWEGWEGEADILRVFGPEDFAAGRPPDRNPGRGPSASPRGFTAGPGTAFEVIRRRRWDCLAGATSREPESGLWMT